MPQQKPPLPGATHSEVSLPADAAGRELDALFRQLLDRLELGLQDPRLHPDQRSDLEDVRRLVRQARGVAGRRLPSRGGGASPGRA